MQLLEYLLDQDVDELLLHEGDTVRVMDLSNHEWWFGSCRGSDESLHFIPIIAIGLPVSLS